MEGNEIKVVCINYKKSHGGNKVKQKLQKKLGKALDNKQISGVKNVHGIKTESVLQVAFNVNYLVLLLKDGRVCRIQCSGNNDVTDNASGYEPGRESFQVVSDLEYARVLQRQYDTERPSWSYPAMDRAHDCMVRLHDPLSSSLYDVHVEHHGVINTPTFDPTPFEEEMAIIDTPPFRERRKFTSPNRDYGRVKSFDKFRMKNFDKLSRSSYYPKFGTLEWLTVEQVCGPLVYTNAHALTHTHNKHAQHKHTHTIKFYFTRVNILRVPVVGLLPWQLCTQRYCWWMG